MLTPTSWLSPHIKPPQTLSAVRNHRVWSTNAVSWRSAALWVSLLVSIAQSTFVDQMYEIQPTSPNEVPEGFLAYHPGIKAVGSTIAGTFSFVERAQTETASTAAVKFFDSAPVSDFAVGGTFSFTLNPVGSILLKQNFLAFQPEVRGMISVETNRVTGKSVAVTYAAYNQATRPFTELLKNTETLPYSYLQSIGDTQNNWRFLASTGTTSVVLVKYSYVNYFEHQAKITHPEGQPPVFLDDPILIDKWTVYIDRSGTVYKDDATDFTVQSGTNVETTTNTVTSTTKISGFYPRYAKVDRTEECTLTSCNVLVVERNDSPAQNFLAMLLLQVQNAEPAQLKFPHLDVTPLGLLSAPIQPATIKRFVVVGGNTFYSFKISSSSIERDTTFTGPAVPGLLAGSVVAGDFETPKYDGLAPAMFLVSNGATYLAKMMVFDTTGCKARTATGDCAELCAAETCSAPVVTTPPTPEETPVPVPESSPVPVPEPTPVKPASPNPWPKERIRRDQLRNQIELLFDKNIKTKPVYSAKVIDLDNQKVYTCAEVGCHMQWQETVLKTTFDTKVQVTRGQLVFSKVQPATVHGPSILFQDKNHRTLQDAQDMIVVDDFQLIKEGWFFSWITVAQLIVFAFRTVGSLVLFGRYPVVAMSMDLLITHCVLLGLYLGPFLTSSELVLQVVGQVKVIWYWYPNPFFGWNRSTLSCAPRPNHGAHGVVCSFFDNYGQNVIGFAAFGVLLTVLHYTAKFVRSRSAPAGRLSTICDSVQTQYGVQYWIAKLDANQLEVMLYVLVSYSLADSSSKSVVGLVLATILMGFYAVVAVGKTVLLKRNLDSTSRQAPPQVSQTGAAIGQGNPVAARYAAPRNEGAGSVSRPEPTETASSRWLNKLVEFLTYSRISSLSISNRLQIFGPIIKLLRTFAVCILLLNHTSSAVAQLIIGISIEALYLGSLFATRTEEKWFDFYSTVGVQLSVLCFLVLRAVSTNNRIPIANNQGGMAVILSLIVFFMFATVGVSMICAFVSLCTAADPQENNQKKTESKNPDQQAVTNKLQMIEELELVPYPAEVVANPVSMQSINFYELEIPEEFIDREDPQPVIQMQSGGVGQEGNYASGMQPPRHTTTAINGSLFEHEKQTPNRTPQDAPTQTGVN